MSLHSAMSWVLYEAFLKFLLHTTVTRSMDSLFLHWHRITLLVLFHVSYSQPSCHGNRFLPGGFYFATGRNMVDNRRLSGYVFETLTISIPVECFRKCQADCRCVSFNHLTTAIRDNCELNEENKYTKPSALEPREGAQYYDLIIDYNVVVSETKIRILFRGKIRCTRKMTKNVLYFIYFAGRILTFREERKQKNLFRL